MRYHAPVLATAIVLMLVGFGTAAIPAGDDKKADEKATSKTRAESPYAASARAARQRTAGSVITTDDLQQRYDDRAGSGSFNVTSGAAASADDAQGLEYLNALNQQRADRELARMQAQAEVDAARRAVEELEKQLLAAKNPFAARADVSEEEKQARVQDTTVAARVARTEGQLAVARTHLAETERNLTQIRTSVSPELPQPPRPPQAPDMPVEPAPPPRTAPGPEAQLAESDADSGDS